MQAILAYSRFLFGVLRRSDLYYLRMTPWSAFDESKLFHGEPLSEMGYRGSVVEEIFLADKDPHYKFRYHKSSILIAPSGQTTVSHEAQTVSLYQTLSCWLGKRGTPCPKGTRPTKHGNGDNIVQFLCTRRTPRSL